MRARHNKRQAPRGNLPFFYNPLDGLVGQLGFEELAVEASDVADAYALGALGLTGTGVGAVTEAKLIHTSEHSLGTACSLYLTLGKEGELAHLS